MTWTPTLDDDYRQLSVDLPYRAVCGTKADAILGVRALDGRDELAIEEALGCEQSAARIASIIIGRCASGPEGPVGLEGARQLSAGDREVVLRGIYRATFASVIVAQVACRCGEPVCFEFDLGLIARVPEEAKTGCNVPRGADLEAAAEGGALALAHFGDPGMAAQMDPNAECEIALTCPACQEDFSAWLDGFELICRKVGDGGGILAQVDQLASVYGWTEADILALPRERRLRYCAFAQARAA